MRKQRTIGSRLRSALVSAVIAGLTASSASAFEASRTLEACEAEALVANLGQEATVTWRGERHEVGPWTFTSHVRVDCNSDACRVRTGRATIAASPDGWDFHDAAQVFERIDVAESLWFGDSDALLSAMRSVTRVVHRVEGEEAAELAEAVSVGWRAQDGSYRLVFMDDDAIAGMRITARTSIACAIDGSACEVDVSTLTDVESGLDAACPISFSENDT